MAIRAFLSRSSGLLKWGPGGPASLGHGPHSSIFSPTDWTSCALRYIIIWRPLFFLRASQFCTQFNPSMIRLYPDIPRPDAPVIYTGAFPVLRAWLGSISYTCTDTGYSKKTCRKRWMLHTNSERGSGKSLLAAPDDNDDILQTILMVWKISLLSSGLTFLL